MSWEGLQGSAVLLVESPLESDRFGFGVDRLTVGWEARPDGSGSVSAAVQEVREALYVAQSDLVIIRYPSQTTAVGAALLGSGRVLLPTGTLLYWSSPTADIRGSSPRPAGVEVKTLEELRLDAPAATALVMDLVSDAFCGYRNHYSVNPLLPPESALAGYQQWAAATANAHPSRTLVLLRDEEPIGLATTSLGHVADHPHIEVLLAGLRTSARGKGLYGILLAQLARKAQVEGISSLFISTQAHNVQVQRAWARLGLLPIAAIDTAHAMSGSLWSDRQSPGAAD